MALTRRLIDYDTRQFPFSDLVAEQLNVRDLAQLHVIADYAPFKRETDQKTVFHKRYYQIGPQFFEVYQTFVRRVVQPIFGEAIVYQKIPSFRVHLPGNIAVGEFHRDRDYNHSPAEVNFWLPLTDAFETNSIWIESAEGKEDFTAVAVKHGQVLVFDGANLKHGNKTNETGKTRVSFDFRVMPKSQYKPSDRGSINTGVKFAVGGYFDEMAL